MPPAGPTNNGRPDGGPEEGLPLWIQLLIFALGTLTVALTAATIAYAQPSGVQPELLDLSSPLMTLRSYQKILDMAIEGMYVSSAY